MSKLINSGFVNGLKLCFEKKFDVTRDNNFLASFLFNVYLHDLDMFIQKLSKRLSAACQGHFNSWSVFFTKKSSDISPHIQYVRYADAFLIGVVGFKSFVKEVQSCIDIFIKGNLHFDLRKSIIKDRTFGSVLFLGHSIYIKTIKEKFPIRSSYTEALVRYKQRIKVKFQRADARLANSLIYAIKAPCLYTQTIVGIYEHISDLLWSTGHNGLVLD